MRAQNQEDQSPERSERSAGSDHGPPVGGWLDPGLSQILHALEDNRGYPRASKTNRALRGPTLNSWERTQLTQSEVGGGKGAEKSILGLLPIGWSCKHGAQGSCVCPEEGRPPARSLLHMESSLGHSSSPPPPHSLPFYRIESSQTDHGFPGRHAVPLV